MMTKHIHAELIKAWADGAEIESKNPDDVIWIFCKYPAWSPYTQYRVKPSPPPEPEYGEIAQYAFYEAYTHPWENTALSVIKVYVEYQNKLKEFKNV